MKVKINSGITIKSLMIGLLVLLSPGITAAWDTVNSPLTSGIQLNGTAFGNNVFVAVGKYGTILTSPDGLVWTKRKDFGADLNAVSFGKGIFTAVGDYGTIFTSPDGITWTMRKDSGNDLNDVFFGKNIFIAAGSYGTILTSSDGVVWTTRKDTGANLIGVSFGNNTFVAVGMSGIILTSSDSVDWTTKKDSGIDLNDVSFGDKTFAAVGNSGTILISPDGNTWTTVDSGDLNALNSSMFANGTFVASGFYGTILTSSNGSQWTKQDSGTSDKLNSVTFGNNRFIAVGNLGTILKADVSQTITEPKIQVTPKSHSFGHIIVGHSSKTRVFVVSNSGNADLAISSVQVSGEFTKQDDNCSDKVLTPKGKCTFKVLFSPQATGIISTELSILSNDPDDPELKVPLFGKGIDIPVTATAGKGGSINPSGVIEVQNGDLTFTITPGTGYELKDVKVDGKSVGAVNSYTFTNITAPHSISATFKIKTYIISSSAGLNGSIKPAGAVRVSYGKDRKFVIKPARKYKIADVVVDGVSAGALKEYTFTDVTAEHTIEAAFIPQ